MRKCIKCEIEKELELFHKHPSCREGRRLSCIECANKLKKEKYQKDSSFSKNRAKIWASKNIERRKEIVLKYAIKTRDQKKEKEKNRYEKLKITDPERVRETNRRGAHLRRARINLVKSTATKKDERFILQSTGGVCLYCNAKMTIPTIDHFIPIVHGGPHSLGNILPCCKTCNCRKKAMNGADWVLLNYGEASLKNVITFLKYTLPNGS